MANTDLVDIKILPIIRVLELMSEGSKKNAACKTADISVSTFDRAIAANPHLANQFISTVRKVLAEDYSDIVSARLVARKKKIEKALETIEDEDSTLSEIVYADSILKEMQDITEKQLGFIGGPEMDEGAAVKVLEMPQIGLRPGKARIHQRETFTEISFEANHSDDASLQTDESLKSDPNILEGQVLPSDTDE